jgi:hypothetical protein
MTQRIATVLWAGGLSLLVGCTTFKEPAQDRVSKQATTDSGAAMEAAPGPAHDRLTAATAAGALRGRALWTGNVAMENCEQVGAGSTFRFR